MKQLNHRGFSLIELLIAVVILGIVTVPLLHTFTTAAGTTARSRRSADADKTAQNAVEILQANSLSSILSAELSPEQETYVEGLFGAEHALVSGSDDESGKRVLTLSGVSYGNSLFDVEMTLDPTAYQTEGGINDTAVTQYTAMDAVYAVPQEASGVDLSTQIRSDAQNIRMTNRTVSVTVSGGTEENPAISVTAVTVFTYAYEVENAASQAMQTFTAQVSVSGSSLLPAGYTAAEGSEVSIYLFMTPCYAAAGRTDNKPYARVGDQDDFQIVNTDNLPCKIFLVREDSTGATAAQQQNYKATVDLAENYTTWPESFQTRIFSNLSQNSAGSGALAGVRCQRRYSTGSMSYKKADFADGFSLLDRQKENRLYDVTVKVFPQGTAGGSASALSVLQATKLQ